MTVVVERSFAEPVELADVQRAEDRGAACLEAHSVRFLRSFFSRERRRMICLYDAADAESVRLAQRQAGLPFDRAWSARRLGHDHDGSAGGETVVVERLLPKPFNELDVRRAVEGKRPCLDAYGCRILESWLAIDGLRMVCRFEAPDAESVRAAQRQAQLPASAVWPATVHEAGATSRT